MSDVIYSLFKSELALLEPEQALGYVPFPWSVRATHADAQACILIEHPYIPPLILDRLDAVGVHNELADPSSDSFTFTTRFGEHVVKIWRGSRHVSISVNGDIVPMTHQVAADLAAVIARLIPATGPITSH